MLNLQFLIFNFVSISFNFLSIFHIRPILAEIQCLVGEVSYISSQVKITPRRATDGFPLQRLQLICAVLEKRLKLSLWNRDVYLNVAGGLKISEPGSDLSVAVTIVSSLVCMNIIPGIAFIGEIGLSGEIRSVKSIEIRISEAVKMGFTTIIIPKTNKSKKSVKNDFSSNYIKDINKQLKLNEIKNDNTGNNDDNNYDNDNSNNNKTDNNHADDDTSEVKKEKRIKNQLDHDKNNNYNNNNNINININNGKQSSRGVIECSNLFEVLTIALNVDSFENILNKLKRPSKKKNESNNNEGSLGSSSKNNYQYGNNYNRNQQNTNSNSNSNSNSSNDDKDDEDDNDNSSYNDIDYNNSDLDNNDNDTGNNNNSDFNNNDTYESN